MIKKYILKNIFLQSEKNLCWFEWTVKNNFLIFNNE